MADKTDPFDPVFVRDPATNETREVLRGQLPFVVNQGFEVLDSAGRVNTRATTTAAAATTKEK